MGKREDILAATLALITEEGLQSVTFAKIFKRANVGSATVYYYFKNKEELVNVLYKEIALHLSRFIIEGYNPEDTLYERFRFFLWGIADFALQCSDEIWFLENYSHSPYIAEELRNKTDPSMEKFFSVIQEGQRLGIIREMNLDLCCQMTTGMILAVIRGFLNNKYSLGEVEIQQTVESCWKAIKV